MYIHELNIGNIKLENNKEALHLSDKGYEVMTQELKKYL